VGDGEAGDALTGVTLACGDWLVRGVVEAVCRVVVVPPTAHASKPNTARPAASANSLRRQ
jgi:hypothetical protein